MSRSLLAGAMKQWPARRRAVAMVVICLVVACRPAAAQVLTIAAASDLQSVLPGIASSFEKQTGQRLRLTFGSSGNLSAQIQNGAPFDVFLSADIEYPTRLEGLGAVERGTLSRYANGHLVLWTRSDSGIDVRGGLKVLSDARVRRIAIANPEFAPYGRAAAAALRHEGLYEAVQGKLVVGENISQTAQFAQSGSADVGLLALSVALSPALRNAGIYFDVPQPWYPAIEQAGVVISSSRQKPAARQFLDYLKNPDSVRILQSFGFAMPQTAR